MESEERQTTYTELLYAHLLDADGSRLTYTHFTSRVPWRSLIDISFNRPIYIQRNKVSIVVFNRWVLLSEKITCFLGI